MKISANIPASILEETMELTGAKTKREAIVIAMSEFNRRKRLEKLAEKLGTFSGFPSARKVQGSRRGENE